MVAVRVCAFSIDVEVPNTFGEHAVGSGGRRAAPRNFPNWKCFPGMCFLWRTWRRRLKRRCICSRVQHSDGEGDHA